MMRSSISTHVGRIHTKHSHYSYHCQQHRSFAIYGVGEGWTGALTREHILKTIPGQYDEEVVEDAIGPDTTNTDDRNEKSPGWFSPSSSSRPVLIYPHDDVQHAAVGWGVSAFLNTQGDLQIVGRPHDLVSLLRMNRMPRLLQRWINRNHDTSAATPVGSMISNLIGWATGNLGGDAAADKETWKIAEKFSLLDDWTKVDITSKRIGNDTRIKQVACGPGFLAVIAECGSLYTMGVNNRGQCGTGTTTNNIWTPQPVRGLSMTSASIGGGDKASDERAAEQDQPIVQVSLGFQQGYALSKAGQVFSWGKASRGQLGRVVDSDQDPWARPIKFDNDNQRVVEIGAGFHHGALLTEDNKVFIWGKSMSRTGDEDETGDDTDGGEESQETGTSKAFDARKPEQVIGLPTDANNEPLQIQRVSCGSHHTAMLMEDGSVYAVGIASDEPVPILDPVELIPSGVLELPIRHFEGHYDRTSVIDNRGMVYQVHLWNDDTLQDFAYFTPAYVDTLLDEGQKIQSIHRGWRHTIIVTQNNSIERTLN